VAKTFDFQCHQERHDIKNFIVTCIFHSIDNIWMKNFCLKLITGAGNVGYAKYARIGRKEGNVGVVTKENQIFKWVSSLDFIMYFYTGVLLVSWLQIYVTYIVGRSPEL
jgi:hypothetical protein